MTTNDLEIMVSELHAAFCRLQYEIDTIVDEADEANPAPNLLGRVCPHLDHISKLCHTFYNRFLYPPNPPKGERP